MSNQSQGRAVAITKDQLHSELVLMKPQVEKMLPKHLDFDKFEGMVINVVAGNTKLLECNQASLLRSVINAADVGLSLNPIMREADILPVWSPNGSVAQFRPRAIGMMKLARQSGEVTKISAHEVYDDDLFEYEFGMDEKLIHKPAMQPKSDRKITHAYCIWQLKDGTKQFEVLDRARIDRARASSEGWKYAIKENKTNSVWHLHEGEMVRKTAIRAASKYMPMSTENDPFLKALEYDRDDGNVVDGTFSEAPEGDQGPAAPQSGATQTAALEAKLGVGGAAPAGESKSTAPAAAPSGQTTDGGAASAAPAASRTRKKADKPAPEPQQPAASEQDGPAGDNPPLGEERVPEGRVAAKDGAPMPDLHGDDLDWEPAKPVDWAAVARGWRADLDQAWTPASWKKWLDDNKPMRDRMKDEAPDWWNKIMKLVERVEAWLRNNAS